MEDKVYIVEGRQFRTDKDREKAKHDLILIEKLRSQIKNYDRKQTETIINNIRAGKYPFYTLLGQDFADELEDGLLKIRTKEAKKSTKSHSCSTEKKKQKSLSDEELELYARQELKRRDKNRRKFLLASGLTAVLCLGYFGFYIFQDVRKEAENEKLNTLKNQELIFDQSVYEEAGATFTLDETGKQRVVLDEYKNLLIKNKKLIGWLKIDDTNIDYPVMQTTDNEYYLDHNVNQEKDKNGSIFLDKDCDVVNTSTNYILYGHHMKSGQMFGNLDKYSDEKYAEDHAYINFDTIYEKGLYKVMYVFRSKVYSEEEVVFKYYQFIDALSETEFNSYMQEMEAMSLYDTGVRAVYGDHLLTLSTCDYQEKNGRFVVVAKKVTAKE